MHLYALHVFLSGIFGFIQHGVNINGYVCNKAGEIQAMWIGKRSDKKQTFPGFFDQVYNSQFLGSYYLSTFLIIKI